MVAVRRGRRPGRRPGPRRTLTEQTILGRVNHDRIDPSLPWRDRIHALALDLRAELLALAGTVNLLNVHILGSVAIQVADIDHTRADPDVEKQRFLWGLNRIIDGLAAHARTGE